MRSQAKIADAIIVGSGTGGATVANELTKAGKKVVVIERGPKVIEVKLDRVVVQKGKKRITGKRIDEKMEILYDKASFNYSNEMVMVGTSSLVGGPTWVIGGNAIKAGEELFRKFGIELSEMFDEAEKDLHVQFIPEKLWGDCTKRVYKAAKELGYEMKLTPKCIDVTKCTGCGNCLLGCPTGANWTAVEYLNLVEERGSKIIPDTQIQEVIIQNKKAIGVKGSDLEGKEVEFYSDVVILSGGGIATPAILLRSGIEEAGKGLFIDIAQTTFGFTKEKRRLKELPMPVHYDGFYEDEGFISMPVSYFDAAAFIVDNDASRGKLYPSLNAISKLQILNQVVTKKDEIDRVLVMMTKIKDTAEGVVASDESFSKPVTEEDQKKLDKAYEFCKKILIQAGCDPNDIRRGIYAGAHNGNTAAMGKVVNENFETYAVKNLFVCDMSIVPGPGLALPPLLMIVAFSKYFGKKLAKEI